MTGPLLITLYTRHHYQPFVIYPLAGLRRHVDAVAH